MPEMMRSKAYLAHLGRNKKEEKPLNVLAAGIPLIYCRYRAKKLVTLYKAKICTPNGTILKPLYVSNTIRIKNNSIFNKVLKNKLSNSQQQINFHLVQKRSKSIWQLISKVQE